MQKEETIKQQETIHNTCNRKVYVVTENGWMDSFTHGELIYLLGVFTDEDTAKKVAEEHDAEITEIELNKVFPLKGNKDKMCNENDYLLGGYIDE